MRDPDYSSIDQKGNVAFNGPLERMTTDRAGMPPRTDAYPPGFERGHVNASSLGGINTPANVVPQSGDLNHGAYYSMEAGERGALQNGASIYSEKTAIADGGDRPAVFQVNDTVTFADGHTETVSLSFANEQYGAQQAWNEASSALPDTFDAPNPGDGLHNSMSEEGYTQLMEETDADLPNISDEYTPADYSGAPSAQAWDSDMGADSAAAADDPMSSDAAGAEAGADAGDCGADPDAD